MILSDVIYADQYEALEGCSLFDDFKQSFTVAMDLEGKSYDDIANCQDQYSLWQKVITEELSDEHDTELRSILERMNNAPKLSLEEIKDLGADYANLYKKVKSSILAAPIVKVPVKTIVFTVTDVIAQKAEDVMLLKGIKPPGRGDILTVDNSLVVHKPVSFESSRFMNAIQQIYQQAYNDQLIYKGIDSKYTLPYLKNVMASVKKDILSGAAVLIDMLLNPPGHRIKREDLFERICDALAAFKEELSTEELELVSRVIIARADVEDEPTGERFILPKNADGAGIDVIGCAHISQKEKAKEITQILLEELKSRYRRLPEKEIADSLRKNLDAIKKITLRNLSFIETLDSKDQRRFNDFYDALGYPGNLPMRVFENGSIALNSALSNRLDIYLSMRGPGNNNPELTRLISIIADMNVLIEKALPAEVVFPSTESSKDASLNGIAVVDQFPSSENDVRLVTDNSSIVHDPDHGLTVAKIADVSGQGNVSVQKWSTNDLKSCFDELRLDSSVKVVNFSSALHPVDDAGYEAFYNLCLQKNVVVAIGNNGLLLTKDNELESRKGAEQGSSPFIENFLQGFSQWMTSNNKSAEDLKLIICENYKMDKTELTERSSSIADGHLFYANIVRVRGDCILNPISGVVESGTSYVAPMVAGALASVSEDNFEQFREKLTNDLQILSWDRIVQEAVAMDEVAEIAPSRSPLQTHSLFAAATSRVPSSIGQDLSYGASRASIAPQDLSEMQRIMPAFGETTALEIREEFAIKAGVV